MSNSRREFLTAVGILGAAAACRNEVPKATAEQKSGEPPAGTPPAFGTAPEVGPPVDRRHLPKPRNSWMPTDRVRTSQAAHELAAVRWRRCTNGDGPPKVPSRRRSRHTSRWDPLIPGVQAVPQKDRSSGQTTIPDHCPTRRGHRVRAGHPAFRLDSQSAADVLAPDRIYLDRIERFDPKLRCVITSRETWHSHRPGKPIRRSPPENTVAPCMVFRGAAKTFWILPAFRRPMAPSPIVIGFRRPMPLSSSG